MTKKVKNSSLSGKSNKTTDITTKVPEKVDVPPAADQADFGFEVKPNQVVNDPITPTEVTPVNIPDTRRRYSYKVHQAIEQEPQLIVSGKSIDLVEIKPGEYPPGLRATYYTGEVDNVLVVGTGPAERSCNHHGSPLSRGKCKVYKAVVNGTDIFMTTGSHLEIKEILIKNGCNDPWDLELDMCGSSQDEKNPVLVMIGSSIVTSTLNVNGSNLLNNATVECKTTYLSNSRVVASGLYSEETVDLDSANIKHSVISGTKWLRAAHSELSVLNLGGIPHITLDRVSTRGDGTFSLTTWCNKGKLALRIADVTLTEFNMNFTSDDLDDLKENGRAENVITIGRRVDYGYFSGITHVPFVRVNKFDLMVGNTCFSGKELNPISFPQEEKKEDGAPARLTYGYPAPATYNPVGYSVSGRLMDDTWTKARKIISFQSMGHNYSGKQNPLGSLGEALVDTLVDQIRSRAKLYVELFSFVR